MLPPAGRRHTIIIIRRPPIDGTSYESGSLLARREVSAGRRRACAHKAEPVVPGRAIQWRRADTAKTKLTHRNVASNRLFLGDKAATIASITSGIVGMYNAIASLFGHRAASSMYRIDAGDEYQCLRPLLIHNGAPAERGRAQCRAGALLLYAPKDDGVRRRPVAWFACAPLPALSGEFVLCIVICH